MKRIVATLGLLALASIPCLAVGAEDANVKTLVDNLKATYDYILPTGLGIMGTFLAVRFGRKVWGKFAR